MGEVDLEDFIEDEAIGDVEGIDEEEPYGDIGDTKSEVEIKREDKKERVKGDLITDGQRQRGVDEFILQVSKEIKVLSDIEVILSDEEGKGEEERMDGKKGGGDGVF